MTIRLIVLMFAFVPLSMFAQIKLDSIHYIDIEPFSAVKNGKRKILEYNYLFHMVIDVVHPYGYADNKTAYRITAKSLINDSLYVYTEKMSLLKQEKTFTIPLRGKGPITIKSKHRLVVLNDYDLQVVKFKKIDF